MITKKTKSKLSRIIPFGLIWLIFSIVYTQLEKGLLGNLNYYPSTQNPYSFTRSIFITPVSALLAGLLIGTLEIQHLNKLFSKKSFSKKIVYKSLAYILIILSFLVITTVISNSIELQAPVYNEKVLNNVWTFLSNYAFLGVAIYMASVIFVSQFYNEVSDNIGRGVLVNFFSGRYHNPVEEERIFMFLDMKSSTTIAENLGHVMYFEMLKEYYSDLSDSVTEYSGEIYQYVGDEMIVSWKLKSGVKNNNCVQCFFAMKAALEIQTRKYNENFGLLPAFKAGFHCGKVTTGEIGVIKKDIIFTGDVLNTAARIQGLCNTYIVDIILSADLIKTLDLHPQFLVNTLGQNELRGRDEKIELYTILKL